MFAVSPKTNVSIISPPKTGCRRNAFMMTDCCSMFLTARRRLMMLLPDCRAETFCCIIWRSFLRNNGIVCVCAIWRATQTAKLPRNCIFPSVRSPRVYAMPKSRLPNRSERLKSNTTSPFTPRWRCRLCHGDCCAVRATPSLCLPLTAQAPRLRALSPELSRQLSWAAW